MDYFRQEYPMLSNILLGNTPKPEPFHDFSMDNNNMFLGHSYTFTHQTLEVPYNYFVGSSSNPNFPSAVTPPAVLNSLNPFDNGVNFLNSFDNGVNFLNPNLGGQYQMNVGSYAHDQYMYNEPHVVAPVNMVLPEGNPVNNELPKKAEERRKTKMVPAKKKHGHGIASSSGVSKKHHIIKGQWTVQEDRLLIQLVKQYGIRKWAQIAKHFNGRVGKQCRERWHNHLRPDIRKDTWSEAEDRILVAAHRMVGNKWSEIANHLPGRTENSIKNHWNTTKRRELSKTTRAGLYGAAAPPNPNEPDPPSSYLQKYVKSVCAATPTLKSRKKPPQNVDPQPSKKSGHGNEEEEEGGGNKKKNVEVPEPEPEPEQSCKVAVTEDPASEKEHRMDMEVEALLQRGVKKEVNLLEYVLQ